MPLISLIFHPSEGKGGNLGRPQYLLGNDWYHLMQISCIMCAMPGYRRILGIDGQARNVGLRPTCDLEEKKKKMPVVGLVLLRLANRKSRAQIISLSAANGSKQSCVKAPLLGVLLPDIPEKLLRRRKTAPWGHVPSAVQFRMRAGSCSVPGIRGPGIVYLMMLELVLDS